MTSHIYEPEVFVLMSRHFYSIWLFLCSDLNFELITIVIIAIIELTLIFLQFPYNILVLILIPLSLFFATEIITYYR